MSEKEEELTPEPSTGSASSFSNLINVIAGARQIASQEFKRFWGNNSDTTYFNRKILTPKRIRPAEESSPSPIASSFHRVLYDKPPSFVRHAEIQTDSSESSFSISANRKRKHDTDIDHQSKINKRDINQLRHREGSSSIILNQDDAVSQQRNHSFADDNNTTEPSRISSGHSNYINSNKHLSGKDVMTGSTSVRRLTLKLEEELSQNSPTSSPSRQRRVESPIKVVHTSPIRYEEKTPESPARVYETVFTSPKRAETSSPPFNTARVSANTNIGLSDDERLQKLRESYNRAQTEVDRLNEDNTPSSPEPSHTISISPLREPSVSPIHPTRSAFLKELKEKSPLRESITRSYAATQLQMPPSRESLTPNPIINKRSTPSPLRESSVAALRERLFSSTEIPTPLRPVLKKDKISSINSPSRNTFTTPAKTPNWTDQLVLKKLSPAEKPNDLHKSTMRKLVQELPKFKLRSTETIIVNGEPRPNPIWQEIYGSRRKTY